MMAELHGMVGGWHLVVSLYAVAIAAGVGTGIAIAVTRTRERAAMLVVAPLAVVAGMLAAEGWHRVCHGSPGLSSMGGIAGGVLAIALASRALGLRRLEVLDALAPGALVGFAIGRIGCFLAGCCYGRPTALAWGVVIPQLGPDPRHPVQLYETVADLALAWWCSRNDGAPGEATGRAMIGYGVGRLLLEPLRDPGAVDVVALRGPSLAQWAALALVVVGLRLVTRRIPLDTASQPMGS
jgi:prolipoprotein diacylglyceryltransferase